MLVVVMLVLMNGVSDMVEVIGDMIEGWTGDQSKTEMEKHDELIKLCFSIMKCCFICCLEKQAELKNRI